MSRNIKSRFNPHVIRAQKEAADQQRRENDQNRRDEELKESLHRKKLREAGDQTASQTLLVTTPVTQGNLSYRNRPEPTLLSSAPQTISIDPNPNPQFVEVDYSESKYQIDLPEDRFLDKQLTAELCTRESNVQQATFDSQNQVRQSEDTEESENTRLRNASANRERKSRIGHRYPSFTRTANDPRLFNNRSNERYNVIYSDQHYHQTHNYPQQTTEPESQPELQQVVPAYEKSRAGPPSDRRILTELAKVYMSDNIKYGGDMYDLLDSKLLIFEDWCNKLKIMGDDRDHAFSIILKGRA
ncbi:hypothetical protein GcM3_188028 [Golovinomyces cichoracearum]|uniref:Uncharacterized protein n=1 Tax=Golovinomyces cichoracearum TaxID=62708 RepID=A0A420HJ41_9PEZI|nr:hypothetical protein GcM3_188028 [Golovinomyces cichoracearum]